MTLADVILDTDTDTDCGFCRPLPSGEGWGEGFQKSVNRDRLQ